MKRAAFLLTLAACGGKPVVAQPPAPPTPPDAGVPDAGPDSPGELSMADVQTAMQPVSEEIREKCAATTTYAGTVKVYITIEPDGTTRPTIESGTGMADVDKCVLDVVGAATFPTSERGQRFHYGFKFK
jgi:outer membrane biosynthesis protein TonB